MRRTRTPWHESNNPGTLVRGATWRGWVWVITAVVMVGLILGGVWWFKVATSEIKGAGDATIQINSGKNQIAVQEAFEDLYGNILAYDRNLDQAARDKAEHPGDSFFATNYSGLVKTCNDAVTKYNADARKVSRSKWLTNDLPFEIDSRDPLTDCRETNYKETPR
jgi:hypothetical protein